MPRNKSVNRTYLTDDRDSNCRSELVVSWAPNGDYYIGTVEEGGCYCPTVVRICTRGGAASRNPALVKAVQDMFQALGGFPPLEEEKP